MNRPRLPALIGLAAAGSQAGHLLVYQMLYGSAAAQAQSQGAHSYFPMLAKSALGLTAVVVIACLLMVGAGRVVALGPRVRQTEAPAYLSLLASLFTIQLAWFILQEITEALVSGSSVAPAPNLLLFGTLGQLPIAIAGAAALRWLLAHVQEAAGDLGCALVSQLALPVPAATLELAWITPDAAAFSSRMRQRALRRRGPPVSS